MTAVASNFEQQVMAKIQSFGNQDLSNTSWVWAPVMSASRKHMTKGLVTWTRGSS